MLLYQVLSLLQGAPLLAEGRFIHMGRRFRHGGSSVDLKDLLILLVVLVAVAGVVWGLSRYIAHREKRGYRSQRGLFRELCKAQGLDWSSGRLLWQLARWQRLPSPAALFVEPQRFEPEQVPEPLSPRSEEIIRLKARLFAPPGEDEARESRV